MANTKTRNQGNDLKEEPENLVSAIRARIAPLDGVDLELPPRLPGREPPSFEKGGILAALRRSPLVGRGRSQTFARERQQAQDRPAAHFFG